MNIPFLADIEKLINEHGSASILKERIELARDKYALLEKEISVEKSQTAGLKAEITNLQSNNLLLLRENEALRLDLSQCEEKIRNLENRIAEIHKIVLSEKEKLILVSVASNSGSEAQVIAQVTSMNVTETENTLNSLRSKLLVSFIPTLINEQSSTSPICRSAKLWEVCRKGHEYINAYKLHNKIS